MGPMPRHCRTVKNHGPKALLAHNLFVCGCLGSWPISGPKDPSSKFFFKNKSGTVQYQKFKTSPSLSTTPTTTVRFGSSLTTCLDTLYCQNFSRPVNLIPINKLARNYHSDTLIKKQIIPHGDNPSILQVYVTKEDDCNTLAES